MRTRPPRATDRLNRARELEIARAGWENDTDLLEELGSYERMTWGCGYYAARPEEPMPISQVGWMAKIAEYRSLFSAELAREIPPDVVALSREVTQGGATVGDKYDFSPDCARDLNLGGWGAAATFVTEMRDGIPTSVPMNVQFAAFAWNYLLASIAKQESGS